MPNPSERPKNPIIFPTDDNNREFFIICPLIRGRDPTCDRAKIYLVEGEEKAKTIAQGISCEGCTYPN